MATEILAESEFPPQAILFAIVMVFSFLKWLYTKIVEAKHKPESSERMESIYDDLREEIYQRQMMQQPEPASISPPPIEVVPPIQEPPALPSSINQQTKAPDASKQAQNSYSMEDVEIARKAKQKRAYERPSTTAAKAMTQRDKTSTFKPIQKNLRDRRALRQAILAKQILDPPKALR